MSPEEEVIDSDNAEDQDTSAAAHEEILEATENLTNLADYCDKNFKDAKVEVERPEITVENALQEGLFGSDELKETAQYAIQAVNAFCCNICILAENVESKIEDLTKSVDGLAVSVSHLEAEAKMYDRKVALKQIKGLTVSQTFKYGKKYKRMTKNNLKQEGYLRTPIDYSIYDHIGVGGLKEVKEVAEVKEPVGEDSVDNANEVKAEDNRSSVIVMPKDPEQKLAKDRKLKMKKLKRTQMPKCPGLPGSLKDDQMSVVSVASMKSQDSSESKTVAADANLNTAASAVRLSMLPPMPADLDLPPPPPPFPEDKEQIMDSTESLDDIIKQLDHIQESITSEYE